MSSGEKYWSTQDAVALFKNKNKKDFFKSEIKFLDLIRNKFCSVLDIGCAGGRLIEVLEERTNCLSYTGVDFVDSSIDSGKKQYPNARFIKADALEIELNEDFDLVYAIGVLQHVADYEALLSRMLVWSQRFLLFDVKFTASNDAVVDLERSYCRRGDDKTHMVLLNWPAFKQHLMSSPGISTVQLWGYETPVNRITHIDEDLLPICSATMLVEKGQSQEPVFDIDLPAWLGGV